MGVCFNSFNYSCGYVSNCISDLLLVEVWRRSAILDSDVCIDILSAVRQEKERFAVGFCPHILIFRKNRAGWLACANTLYNKTS